METRNWQAILQELNIYASLAFIADASGIPKTTLADIKSGKKAEPTYTGGAVILKMLDRERNKENRA